MGYSYDENRKCYYTDGHERPDVVKYRNEKFLNKYFNYELKAYRWVQLNDEEVGKLIEQDKEFPKTACYKYIDEETNIQMNEFHVDTHKSLCMYVSDDNLKYGGN